MTSNFFYFSKLFSFFFKIQFYFSSCFSILVSSMLVFLPCAVVVFSTGAATSPDKIVSDSTDHTQPTPQTKEGLDTGIVVLIVFLVRGNAQNTQPHIQLSDTDDFLPLFLISFRFLWLYLTWQSHKHTNTHI